MQSVSETALFSTTETGGARGTARYMCPELISGSVSYTKESDIWAFGMTVYVRYMQYIVSYILIYLIGHLDKQAALFPPPT